MRTTFYLNGKRISKKALTELIGKEWLNKIIKEDKEIFMEDPYTALYSFLGSYGMLLVVFS